jgi:proteasome lid subunit RPN8/RPN11
LIEKVQIKTETYEKLLNLLQKHTPNIICGFLVGERDDKNKILRVTDVREIKTRCNPRIHFQPLFSDFRRVADEIHKEGKSIVGEFHTHPEGNSNPTGRDMKIMRWMKTGFWIIVSKNSITAMLFDAEELKINITKIPIEIV